MSNSIGKTNSIVLALALLIATPLLAQNKVFPAAPIPTQIATAKTAFISFAAEGAYIDDARDYNALYAALATWGHYQLTTRPADAELIFKVQRTAAVSPLSLSVQIIDRATGVILWTISEPFTNEPIITEANKEKSVAATVGAVIGDLKVLAQPNATATSPLPPPKKKK